MKQSHYMLLNELSDLGESGGVAPEQNLNDTSSLLDMNDLAAEYDINDEDANFNDPTPANELEQSQMKTDEEKSHEEMLKELTEEEETPNSSEPEKEVNEKEFLTLDLEGESKILSKEEAQEYAAKGLEYERIQETFSKEKEEFQLEAKACEKDIEEKYKAFNDQVSQFKEKVQQFDAWDHTLKNVQEKYPELFDQINEFHHETMKVLDNPVTRSLNNQIAELKSEISSFKEYKQQQASNAELEAINTTYKTELNSLKTDLIPGLNKLGIKINDAKVQEAYIKGEAQNLTVKDALFQVYGPTIQKAYDSKLKKARVEGSLNRGSKGIAGLNASQGNTVNSSINKMSWNELEQNFDKLLE